MPIEALSRMTDHTPGGRGSWRGVVRALFLAGGLLGSDVRTVEGQVPFQLERSTADSAMRRVKREIRDALIDGVSAQRQAWQAVEQREHREISRQPDGEPDMQRLAMTRCHTDGRFSPSTYAPGRRVETVMAPDGRTEVRPVPDIPYPLPTMLRSRVPLVALCPNWIPTLRAGTKPTHEYRGVDLDPARLMPFTDSVVASLERATRAYPDEPFFLGQLVRVLVDNGRAMEAQQRPIGCGADLLWCELLRGYAMHAAGHPAAADTIYRRVLRVLPADARCDLLLIQPLLVPQDSAAYGVLPCEARDGINRKLWWLASPFWGDRMNARLVEHISRRVRNALVGQLSVDVHHDLRTEVGGDAVVAMRIRYGWPTHMFWPGAEHEVEHFGYQRARNAPPFAAPEYARNALTLVPGLHEGRGSLVAGELADVVGSKEGAPGETAAYSSAFPREFMLNPAGQVLATDIGQMLLLRRDSATLVMAAGFARVSERAEKARRDSIRPLAQSDAFTVLAFSSGLDDIAVLDSVRTTYGQRVQLTGQIRRPGVLAVEHRVRRAGLDGARARYGVPELLTTGELPAGRCALSQPALIEARDARPGVTRSAALLPSLSLSDRAVGVLWESYGVRPFDTVTVSVEVRAERTSSVLGVFGRPFGRGNSGPQSIAIQWTEPNGPAITRRVALETPTLERRLTVNLEQLRRGWYVLQLQIETAAGCQAVSAPRRFEVR